MELSRIGFGTYRVGAGSKVHAEALRLALSKGINLIDTSSNYTDGKAEELIGEVLSEFDRSKIVVVSKFGYIQGQNMTRLKDGLAFPEIVEYQENCFHCIHPDFMRDQLDRSLKRLGTKYIDVYLLHNPEYFLMNAIYDITEKEKFQKEMLDRIYRVFVALEEEVKKGRIKEYGISSNSFSIAEDDPAFLPYKGLLGLAKKASEKVGTPKNSFTTLQMPGNLLEKEGLENCAKWAYSNSLKVLINRPLNAIGKSGLIRLASYGNPEKFDELKKKVEAIIVEYGSQKGFFEEIFSLDGKIPTFSHLEYVWYYQIFPAIRNLQFTKEEMAFVDEFMHAFIAKQKYLLSLKVKKDFGYDEPIQDTALKFLLDKKEVSCVLLGMRKEGYVENAVRLLQ